MSRSCRIPFPAHRHDFTFCLFRAQLRLCADPLQFIAMTAALVVLTMPLAAGVARYGVQNAYFFIVR